MLASICPSQPLKSRETKLYMEREGEVTNRGLHSTEILPSVL